MIAFMAVLYAGDYAPVGYELELLALRVAAPALTFLYFWKTGSYPELGGFRPGGGIVLDIGVGLAVAAVWVAPFLVWPELRPEASEAFNPDAAGEENRFLMLGLRFLGFALVTPFIEELLVRSYIMRAAEVFNDEDPDFRKVPVGHFAWVGFWVTVAWFTFTHVQWEWPVAFLTCVIYNLWLYRRKHIGSLILAHAMTNASLLIFVAMNEDLWFFL